MKQQFSVMPVRFERWRKGTMRLVTRPECVVEVDIPELVIRQLAARAARNRSGKAVLGGITAKVTTTAQWQEQEVVHGTV
jgi:hypothetical protein